MGVSLTMVVYGVSRMLTSLGSVLPADFGYGKKIKDWLKKTKPLYQKIQIR